MKTKKIVSISILASIAIVLSILESFIPTGVPGVKIGLANAIVLICFYMYSPKEALIVDFLRIFLVGLLYSGLFSQSFLLSLVGGILSYLAMLLFFKIKKDNIFLVSIFGAVFHSIGQILVAMIILSSLEIIYYLPIIFSLSIPCGILTAIIARLTLKALKIELKKPNVLITSIISISLTSIILISIITISIYFISYKRQNSEGSIATLTYQNEVVLNIPLKNPSDYVVYNRDVFVEYEEVDDSSLFTLYLYNKDEKDYFYMVVEVLDEQIRIKSETCKKHICSNRGFIRTKYERIVCLPNTFIISINDYSLDEIDSKM